MMRIKEMGFGTVHYYNARSMPTIFKYIQKGYRVNQKMFIRKIPPIRVFVCDTDAQYKKHVKYYYFKWSAAVVLRDGTIVIRKRPTYPNGKKKMISQATLIHEMNHVFWKKAYKTISPIWLAEGMACEAAKNFRLKTKKLKKFLKEKKITYDWLQFKFLNRRYNQHPVDNYLFWANFARYMSQLFSTKKIMRFMEEYSEKPLLHNYKKMFSKHFGHTERELFDQFMQKYASG